MLTVVRLKGDFLLGGHDRRFLQLRPGSCFIELFLQKGVEVTPEAARGPMDKHKLDHISRLIHILRVAAYCESHLRVACPTL